MIRKWMRSLAAASVLLSTTGYAIVIPVYDVNTPLNKLERMMDRIERGMQHAETIVQMKAQITSLKTQFDWHRLMAGGWRNILARLPGKHADKVRREVVKLEQAGWPVDADIDRWRRQSGSASAVEAIAVLRKVMDGRTQGDARDVRASQEQVWGDVPVTREGVKVESTYQTMATVTAEQGRIQLALKEAYENIAELERQMDAGEVAPEDRERMRGRLDVQRARVQTLQVDATNSTNQLLVQMAGLSAGNIVNQQRSAMERKAMGFAGAGFMNFARKPRAAVVEQ